MPRPTPICHANHEPSRNALAALLIVVLVCWLSACTGLPKNVDRPVSHAWPEPARTALGQLVERHRASEQTRNASGFTLLSGPQAAYSARLALVEGAQRTLDLQYYAIHADASSERLLRSVLAASRRGVRVRLLLDDFHSTGRDALVMRLAFAPNIEMRMFNPLAGARGSTLGRMVGALGDFWRVQQRMHNKLFIADNAMGVTGGRNLGDAYFGHADTGNFVDLDVLAAGPVVQELSRSFDSYWNNERAYPVQSLVTRQELEVLRERTRAAQAPRLGGADEAAAAPSPAHAAPTVPADEKQADDAIKRARVWDQQPMDLSQTRFVWAPAAVLVDKPAKIPPDGSAAMAQPEQPPARATPLAITTRIARAAGAPVMHPSPAASAPLASPSAPASDSEPPAAMARDAEVTEAQSDTVVDGLLQLMGLARRDLTIISPYFVPGPDMKRAFAAARERGVRVRVLTNSLASNDAPIAHAGYARHRPDLLAMGIELYEMRSELPSGLRGSLGSTGSMGGSKAGSSRAMLHSKLMVVDGRLLVVGSMNLDMRSQRQNTEVALLIRSTELSGQAVSQMEAAMEDAAWRVTLQPGGRLLWNAPRGSDLPDATQEPDASAPLRLMLRLLGPLAPDELL